MEAQINYMKHAKNTRHLCGAHEGSKELIKTCKYKYFSLICSLNLLFRIGDFLLCEVPFKT
jgi:hypothetical protein